MGNKTGCKKGRQKEKKKECEERILKTDSSSPLPLPRQKKKAKDKKKLLNYNQLAEKYALSVKNLFLAIPIQKLLQKGGSGQKCRFFWLLKWSY